MFEDLGPMYNVLNESLIDKPLEGKNRCPCLLNSYSCVFKLLEKTVICVEYLFYDIIRFILELINYVLLTFVTSIQKGSKTKGENMYVTLLLFFQGKLFQWRQYV